MWILYIRTYCNIRTYECNICTYLFVIFVRMNVDLCSRASHGRFAHALLAREKSCLLFDRPRNIRFFGGAHILVKCVCHNYGYLSIKIPFHDGGVYFSEV